MIEKRGKPIRLALSGGVLILPILATKLLNLDAMSKLKYGKRNIQKENSSIVNYIDISSIVF